MLEYKMINLFVYLFIYLFVDVKTLPFVSSINVFEEEIWARSNRSRLAQEIAPFQQKNTSRYQVKIFK